MRKLVSLVLLVLLVFASVPAFAADADLVYQEDKLTLTGGAIPLGSADGINGQVVQLTTGTGFSFIAENSGNALEIVINGVGTNPTADIYVNDVLIKKTYITTATYTSHITNLIVKEGDKVELKNFTGTSYMDYVKVTNAEIQFDGIYHEDSYTYIGDTAAIGSTDGSNGLVVYLTYGRGFSFIAQNDGNAIEMIINGVGTNPTADIYVNDVLVKKAYITTATYTGYQTRLDVKAGDKIEFKNFTATSYLDCVKVLTTDVEFDGIYEETDCAYEGAAFSANGNGEGKHVIGAFQGENSFASFMALEDANTLEITHYGDGTAKLYINGVKVKTVNLYAASPYPVVKFDVAISKGDIVKLADFSSYVYIDCFKAYTEAKSTPLYYQAEDCVCVGTNFNDDSSVGDFAYEAGVEKSIAFTALNDGVSMEIVSNAGHGTADLYVNNEFIRTVSVGIGNERGRVVFPATIKAGDTVKLTNFTSWAYIDWFGVLNDVVTIGKYGIIDDNTEIPAGTKPVGDFTAFAEVYSDDAILYVAQYNGNQLVKVSIGKDIVSDKISVTATVEEGVTDIKLMLWKANMAPIALPKNY